ncbi:MAG: heme lyase CcmF/NrfE family subunit [Candidatus Eisenbacteria bacterium]|uniref:Heme lyase CcmF/NrfE family subunit n=1 Tax=Eiseniibacteriota bacterium TaxID=2212470 RepID=A0A538TQR5_UNCEI|nr:MAG: heme lyase CcmF/NrfE family subunit [Candidatus Eisenbacteria bacterium]
MSEIGRLALILGFACSCYAVLSIAWGLRTGMAGPLKSGRRAVWIVCGLTLLATIILERALVARDFSYRYVAEHTSLDLPPYYAATSLWAGQEGSLLLWLLILSSYGAAFLWCYRKRFDPFYDAVAMVVATVMIFFTGLLTFVCSPFRILATPPADGNGLNPLLQDPGMMIHPPILYTGYVGFIIPFAFGIAVLLMNRTGTRWIEEVRRWTLFNWMFLGFGVLLGARWAYIELGWGGYWGWDPVENASLMPWLVGTAFLHSVMIEQRRGMLKTWNVVLIVLTFELSIFGTFLTRSGVLTSVHSFAESDIGPWFLGFILISSTAATALILYRKVLLESENRMDAVVSREGSFLFNNVLFVALTFATFLGTTFPVISEAVTGEKISVSAPFFNRVNVPIALALLLLTGIGPVLSWKRATASVLKRNFVIPSIVGLLATLTGIPFGLHGVYPIVCVAGAAFVLATIAMEFARGIQARKDAEPAASPVAMIHLVQKNKRRYGGYIVHLGVVMIFVGVLGSSVFQKEAHAPLKPGESLAIGSYTLTLQGVDQKQIKNAMQTRAAVEVSQGGKALQLMHPSKAFYSKSQQPMTEVALRPTPAEDLYLILGGVNDDGSASIQAYINPLVSLVWLGGIVMVFGTLIALSDRMRLKREEKLLG